MKRNLCIVNKIAENIAKIFYLEKLIFLGKYKSCEEIVMKIKKKLVLNLITQLSFCNSIITLFFIS